MPGNRRNPARAVEARERLLAAPLRCAARDGGSALSLQAIAGEASVSKALILYHYRDKDELLATFVRWLAERVVQREQAALAHSTATSVLEDYWRLLEGELQSSEQRVLLELSQERGAEVRKAIEEIATRRHTAAESTVATVFRLLDLSPRLPATMLASCELAFRDGLMLWGTQQPERNARVSFDVFWLSLLSLAR